MALLRGSVDRVPGHILENADSPANARARTVASSPATTRYTMQNSPKENPPPVVALPNPPPVLVWLAPPNNPPPVLALVLPKAGVVDELAPKPPPADPVGTASPFTLD